MSLTLTLVLWALFTFTSAITVVLGVGGGMLLFGIMSALVPVQALVPVHGAMMLSSNASRFLMFRQHVVWATMRPILGGVILGASVGSLLNFNIPTWALQLLIGSLMLGVVWWPKQRRTFFPSSGLLTGLTHGFLNSMSGMGGLIQGYLSRQPFTKLQKVANLSIAITVMNLIKMPAFAFAGFNFAPYMWVLLGTVPLGFVAGHLGRHMLSRVSEKLFNTLFKTILTIMALRLLGQAVYTLCTS